MKRKRLLRRLSLNIPILRLYSALIVILCFLAFHYSSLVLAGEKVNVKGVERMWGDTDGDQTFLEGQLVTTQDQNIIYAPRASMDKEKKIAIFSGGVKLVQEEVTITGDQLEVNFDEDQGVFSGNVRLEREETKDEEGKIDKERITLTCVTLEINTETKDFTANTDVVMEHKDFTANARKLVYLDQEEIMTFSGNAYLQRDQEEVWGEEITINLEKKIFEVKGGVEINFEVDEDDEEESTEKGRTKEDNEIDDGVEDKEDDNPEENGE